MSIKNIIVNYCNYNTDRRQYWYQHTKGKKHIRIKKFRKTK